MCSASEEGPCRTTTATQHQQDCVTARGALPKVTHGPKQDACASLVHLLLLLVLLRQKLLLLLLSDHNICCRQADACGPAVGALDSTPAAANAATASAAAAAAADVRLPLALLTLPV